MRAARGRLPLRDEVCRRFRRSPLRGRDRAGTCSWAVGSSRSRSSMVSASGDDAGAVDGLRRTSGPRPGRRDRFDVGRHGPGRVERRRWRRGGFTSVPRPRREHGHGVDRRSDAATAGRTSWSSSRAQTWSSRPLARSPRDDGHLACSDAADRHRRSPHEARVSVVLNVAFSERTSSAPKPISWRTLRPARACPTTLGAPR